MSSVATIEPTASTPYWVEEGRTPSGRSRFLAKISGLHCSLCTGTIEKALGRMPGVDKVAENAAAGYPTIRDKGSL